MKKCFIIGIIAICAAMLGGHVFYTYQASKEAGLCIHLAIANERDGYMDDDDVEYVKRFVKRQRSIVWPVRSYDRLERMRQNLERIRKNAIESEM